MDNLKRLDTSMKSIEAAALLADSFQKEAAHSKATFSPAMDKSPALKGGQSRLPDKIQAGILKKKLRGKLLRKTGSVDFVHNGLSQALAVLYEGTYGSRMEKRAFKNPFSLWAGVGRTAATTGGLGGAGFGLNRLRQLRALAAEGEAGVAARTAMGNQYRAQRAAARQAAKEGKTFTPKAFDRSVQEVEFLKKMKGLKGTKFADNPMAFLKAYGPEVSKAFLEGGGAAGLAGGIGRFASNWAKRKKMLDTAKAVAVPAALGLGGYALLKD